MHVIAWLLTQRAVQSGELRPSDALDPARRLGHAPTTDAALLAMLPEKARHMIESSADLHRRVARLDDAQDTADATASAVLSPVLSMRDRLERAF
jgi:regulator of CtrA degradation